MKGARVELGTKIDVWVTRANEGLWYGLANTGEPPMRGPRKAESVASLLKVLRRAGYTVVTVGICDPMMIGL